MIVVVGSLNVDLVVPVERVPAVGETVLGGDHARHLGGKGANQAVAAARAGAAVRMVGCVGDDELGAALRAGLAADAVDHAYVTALAGVPTGLACIAVDASGGNAIVVSPGANARLRPDDLPAAAFEGATLLLLQLEVPLDTTLRAAELARAAGARVVLNLAPAQRLDADQLRHVDVLVVNEHEAALLADVGVDAVRRDPLRTAGDLTALVATIVVTLGADGVAWACRDGATGRRPALDVVAVDSTAAGDAFVGAFATALDRGEALERALTEGTVAGALAVTVRGAQTSLPTRAAIDARRALLEDG